MPAKKEKVATLPHDAFFYSLPLKQNKQRLTREMLEKHYPVPKGRKAHMGIKTVYKSYIHNLVTIEVNLNDQSHNTLFLQVGLTDLDVACTCDMPDDKLCYHAYMGLYSLTWAGYLDFDRFYWPGLESDEKTKRKFLSVEVDKNWIAVRPKFEYGRIFKSASGFVGSQPPAIKDCITNTSVQRSKEVIAYCVVFNYSTHSNALLPTLVPCLGLTGKDDKQIVSFKQFINKDKPIQKIGYTPNQQRLNEICEQQYAIAEKHDQLPEEGFESERAVLKQEMFELWHIALPLIVTERYTYRYHTFWFKYLKEKPRKSNMYPCKFGQVVPVLSFILRLHKDHFSMIPVIAINGKVMNIKFKPHLFVFDEETDTTYLMPSIKDDELLKWIKAVNSRLTILKEHFEEFYHRLLHKVSLVYEVFYINKSGVKTTFSFDAVKKEI
jgi:hypothetical protein